jgi:hypothetical protein
MRTRPHPQPARRAIAVIFVVLTMVIAPATVTFSAPAEATAPASKGVIEPASLSLTLGFTGPNAWRFGQVFDSYLLVRAPGIPIPAELGSADGRTVVSVTPAPRVACQNLQARFAGSSAPGQWCLHLRGLRVGTTVQGNVTSLDAQLNLQVFARDPMVPLPLLVTLLGRNWIGLHIAGAGIGL